jgi:hypothetical protein
MAATSPVFVLPPAYSLTVVHLSFLLSSGGFVRQNFNKKAGGSKAFLRNFVSYKTGIQYRLWRSNFFLKIIISLLTLSFQGK